MQCLSNTNAVKLFRVECHFIVNIEARSELLRILLCAQPARVWSDALIARGLPVARRLVHLASRLGLAHLRCHILRIGVLRRGVSGPSLHPGRLGWFLRRYRFGPVGPVRRAKVRRRRLIGVTSVGTGALLPFNPAMLDTTPALPTGQPQYSTARPLRLMYASAGSCSETRGHLASSISMT